MKQLKKKKWLKTHSDTGTKAATASKAHTQQILQVKLLEMPLTELEKRKCRTGR